MEREPSEASAGGKITGGRSVPIYIDNAPSSHIACWLRKSLHHTACWLRKKRHSVDYRITVRPPAANLKSEGNH